jgi:uncharacterized protein YaiL (DUF2058 family)
MSNSLIDQLKNAGLVHKEKVHKVKHAQYENKKQKIKKGSIMQLDETKIMVKDADARKVERDQQINMKKKEEIETKAIVEQIIQLIKTNRIGERDGVLVYNFADVNVIRQLYVSDEIHKQLVSRKLIIVKSGENYELVPKSVAERIKQLDANYIINNDYDLELVAEEKDAYTDYKIPEDLIW